MTFDNVTLNRGTDYTVTANFDDAGVGNGKNITATVTLMGQAAKNYALEQSSFTTTGNIIKAAAPDFAKETGLVIVNGHEKTYTVTPCPRWKRPKSTVRSPMRSAESHWMAATTPTVRRWKTAS